MNFILAVLLSVVVAQPQLPVKPGPCVVPSDVCQIEAPPSLIKPMAFIPIAMVAPPPFDVVDETEVNYERARSDSPH